MLESIAYRFIAAALVGIENFVPHQNSEEGLCVFLDVKGIMEINSSTTESIFGHAGVDRLPAHSRGACVETWLSTR